MKISVLTLFPEMLRPVLSQSILGRAIENGCLDVRLTDIRAYTKDKHRNTDDYPFGGGAGMVMQAQPVCDAIRAVDPEHRARRIYLSPRGRTLTQRVVEELAKEEALLLLCGHYEGVDERALEMCIDEELSIGDYVLTGGELGAMVVIDSVSRMLPGVLGSAESAEDESFTMGLLEYPQYSRPASFEGMDVPKVLLGGNHADIVAWRRRQSLTITWAKRPDLLKTAPLTEEDHAELTRLERTDALVREYPAAGLKRMDMFEEKDYAKAWFAHFIPSENRAAAKKLCFSGRRHIGYLVQAFEKQYLPEAETAPLCGSAVLYLNDLSLALTVEHAEEIDVNTLPRYALLTTENFGAACAVEKNGRVYRAIGI